MSDLPILILKTGEAPPPVKSRFGDFEDWIALGMGQPVDSLDVASVYLGASLPSANRISGVIVTGSPAMVTDRPDWSEASARWLANIVVEDSVPVLGVCYGHQLLAHGLGGEVGPNPKGREMGTVEVTFHDEDDAAAGGADGIERIFDEGVYSSHMSHVESVLRPPEGARVLAHSTLDPHSVIAFGPRQWGVQFHPEFDRAIMRAYIEARREIVSSEGLDADAMMIGVVDTFPITGVLARFAKWIGRV
jgi:GMP synthase (glutamine-hydrolysing)